MKVTESRESVMRVLLNANKRTVGPKCINMRYFIDMSAHRPRYAVVVSIAKHKVFILLR